MKRRPTFNAQRAPLSDQRPKTGIQRSRFDVRCSAWFFSLRVGSCCFARNNSQNSRLKAFTLIEVLIALTVFAMASTYLMSTFANTLSARERSVSNDVLHADIQAVRMQLLLEPNLEDAEDGGDYPTLNHGEARWEAFIQPTEIVDLFEVDLSIEFTEPPEDSAGRYQETLYLLRPTWSEGDERSQLLEDKRQELERSRSFDRF